MSNENSGIENLVSIEPLNLDQEINWPEMVENEIKSYRSGLASVEIQDGDNEKINQIIEEFKTGHDYEMVDAIKRIKENLPSFMLSLADVSQGGPHKGIDTLTHTFNAFNYLDTEQFSDEEKLITRLSLLLHDVAKIEDLSSDHPRKSGIMASDILENTNLNQEQKDQIIKQITYHDALGDISRRDSMNIFRPAQLLSFFNNEQELKIHKAIVMADVASIPGLATHLNRIEQVYFRLISNLDRLNWSFTENPDESVESVINEERLQDIINKVIPEIRSFDNIDIDQDMSERQENFDRLSPKEKQYLEKYIISASLDKDDFFLKALQATGKETDLENINQLEKKYHVKLDEAKIATQIFKSTYAMWKTSFILRNEEHPDREELQLEKLLQEIYEATKILSKFNTEATHSTNPDSADSIKAQKAILESVGSSHYEGDGTYTGLLGSFRGWSEYMFKFGIKLSDVLPIIVDFNYPETMANVLCSYLDIESNKRTYAVPRGRIEWYHRKFDYSPVTAIQKRLLGKILNCDIDEITDEDGLPTLTANTQEKPIVWGSLVRSLNIRRFIPRSELPYSLSKKIEENPMINNKLKFRIKGISLKDLNEELE